MTDNDRETLISLLNRAGVDYDASDSDSVVIETERPNVFIEVVFWPGNGTLSKIAVQDWNGMHRG